MYPPCFGPGGHRPRPVIEIPMATPPLAAAATQALVKAATAAPPKGKASLHGLFSDGDQKHL